MQNPYDFDPADADETIAQGVADALTMVLPPACVAGVAGNARLLLEHWRRLQRALADGSGSDQA